MVKGGILIDTASLMDDRKKKKNKKKKLLLAIHGIKFFLFML
jgi:hypothetical protein